MPFQNPNGSFRVSADTLPSRFVTMTQNFTVATANVGDKIIGVTADWVRSGLPGTVNHANSGETAAVYGESQECYLVYGADVVYGQALKSDSTGRGVHASPTDSVGAIALEDGFVGELHRVRIEIGNYVGS